MIRPKLVLHARDYTIELGAETRVMAIVNCSPDSFSGDGKKNLSLAFKYARRLIQEGADILDIGGESTRPNAKSVNVNEEIKRVIPLVHALARLEALPISVDTSKIEVAKEALHAGASIINNVQGTKISNQFLKLIRDYKAAIVLMHMRGTPLNMQHKARYKNVVNEVIEELKISVEKCLSLGIKKERIMVDPGIGFAKNLDHNLILINRLYRLNSLGCPILLGTSRKSFIGELLNKKVEDRLWGTLASVNAGAMRGAHIVRVHDVGAVKETLKVTDAILNTN